MLIPADGKDINEGFLGSLFLIFFQMKVRYLVVGKKINPLFVRGWYIKFSPHDHNLSSLCKSRDARLIFYPIYPILRLTMSSYINKMIALLERTAVESSWELGNHLQARSKMALLFAYPDDRFSHVNA